jgi:rhamnopyranosyl-N-acetylglucosaminyl-diphospho-decaprenol beta-1,3/1,4-galactofuranosyltransferase
MSAPRVVAVVVTWQRLDLLRESLAALRAQARPPDAVVVVDNASSDGTPDAIAVEHPEVDLVRLRKNTGGAGGFAVGLHRALERHDADLIWIMDDDTVPQSGALAALLDARDRAPQPRPALVASRVVWEDGRDHPMNTPRPYPLAGPAARRAAAAAGCVPARSASFVSVLVDAAAVREVGLPLADYFLWNDDFEFTTRLLRGRRGLWCPASVVVHRTKVFGSTDVDPGPRFYYEVRNKVWLFTRSRGLTPLERLLYLVSTVLRWGHTLRRSSDPRQLRRAAVRGVRDGLRAGPRPNAEVLAPALAAAVEDSS